ncbi:hypothetical protein TNCV_1864511 [Trichonephila clavipes]|nr:hypothetical protein TNCV_1864511 [Trichonephila clavipes]
MQNQFELAATTSVLNHCVIKGKDRCQCNSTAAKHCKMVIGTIGDLEKVAARWIAKNGSIAAVSICRTIIRALPHVHESLTSRVFITPMNSLQQLWLPAPLHNRVRMVQMAVYDLVWTDSFTHPDYTTSFKVVH